MVDYHNAAVCRRGHIETSATDFSESISAKCPKCGATVLTACENCQAPIRGLATRGFSAYPGPPSFCDHCGTPFPWLDRQGLLWELENRLDDETMPANDRLVVREQLDALRAGDELDEDDQVRRWRLIKELAPGLIEGGKVIVFSVTSAAIQKKLGI